MTCTSVTTVQCGHAVAHAGATLVGGGGGGGGLPTGAACAAARGGLAWYCTDTCSVTNTLSAVLVSHSTFSCCTRRLISPTTVSLRSHRRQARAPREAGGRGAASACSWWVWNLPCPGARRWAWGASKGGRARRGCPPGVWVAPGFACGAGGGCMTGDAAMRCGQTPPHDPPAEGVEHVEACSASTIASRPSGRGGAGASECWIACLPGFASRVKRPHDSTTPTSPLLTHAKHRNPDIREAGDGQRSLVKSKTDAPRRLIACSLV